MNHDIDAALLAAIRATSATAPKKKPVKTCQLIAFVSDDEALHASADKPQYVLFTKYLNTRAAAVAA